MATVRNASPVTQTIPSLGLEVPAGETFEAPADVAAELVERPDFDKPPAPKPTKSPASGKSKES